MSSLAIPALRDALLGKDDEIALKSAAILAEIGPASIPALTQALSDKRFYSNFARNKAVADALGRIGPTAVPSMLKVCVGEGEYRPITWLIIEVVRQMGSPAVPGLEETASKGTPGSRYLSALLMGDIKNEAATPVLIRLLKDDQAKVRTNAETALQKIGQKAKSAVPALIYAVEREHDLSSLKVSPELADEPSFNFRAKAVEALGEIAPQADEVLDLLMKAVNDKESDVRSQAVTVMGKMPARAKTVVPILVKSLRDGNGNVRRAAATALGQLGSEAKPAILELLNISADVDGRVRKEAIEALDRIAPETEDLFIVVSKAKDDKYPAVRSQAATVMGKMRARAKTVVPILIAALRDESANVRQAAATALGQLGPEAKVAVSGLVEALRDGDGRVRKEATIALGKIGPGAKDAVSSLVKVLIEGNPESRNDAAQALRGIGSAAVPLLIEALHERDADARRNAAAALGGIQPKPREAVSVLASTLKDKEPLVRQASANALAQIGPEAQAAVSSLVEALRDENVEVRRSSASALGQIGYGTQDVVFALSGVLSKDENAGVRSSAASALGRVRQERPEALSALIRALDKDENSGVRNSAVNALGRIGAGAKIAMPVLIDALDKKTDLRQSAADSLANIAKSLEDAKDTESVPPLKKAYQSLLKNPELATPPYPQHEHAKSVQRAIEHLNLMWWRQYINEITVRIHQYPLVFSIVVVYILWVATCMLLLLVFPLALLRINDFLRLYKAKLRGRTFEIGLPLRYVFFVGFLNYRPRVLDAWVRQHIATARRRFLEITTVSQRAVHIPVPVRLESNVVAVFEAKNLKSTFLNRIGFLLITGEGGSGKTSLACQVARWAMADKPDYVSPTILWCPC